MAGESSNSGGGSGLTKWLLIGGAVVAFMIFGYPAIFGGSADARQPLGPAAVAPETRADETTCELSGDRFSATLTTRGASLTHLVMKDAKYAKSVKEPDTRIDLVTPDLLESRRPLRTNLRVSGEVDQQVPYDDVDWALEASDERSCTFVYKDENASIKKTVALTDRPFELDVKLEVTNLSETARTHRLTVEQGAWRTKAETTGKFGRLPEYETHVVTHTKEKTQHLATGDFEASDFKDKEFTAERWRRTPGDGVWVSTSTSYFANAVLHVDGPTPASEALIEDVWNVSKYPKKDDDPNGGHVFRTRLAYPEKALEKDETATYEVLAFMGPKERNVLSAIGGPNAGENVYKTTELIDMSVFVFGNLFTSTLGKVLVGYVYWLAKSVGSWGLAIILLTITVKLIVFPLGLTGLRSSVGMRRIKPQLDEINAKHKDDMMARNLATQELMRKEKIPSPMIGCLPALLQMPIWLTLYAALRSSVELYHQPFGPLIPDLSEPAKYYVVIPLLLGASSFLQQKLMMSSMPNADPSQQKLMLFMMPIVFTVLNVFLPAGLGVYMLTNTWLGIGQQVLMEKWIQKKVREQASTTIQVREIGDKKSEKAEAASAKKTGPAKKTKSEA